MKYKIGDIVKLKSAEEMNKNGCADETSSSAGGKKVIIVGFYDDKYVMKYNDELNFLFLQEKYIESILGTENLIEDTYSFDELKRRVDDLKDYAIKLSSELNDGLCIEVKTYIDDYRYVRVKGSSKIEIED